MSLTVGIDVTAAVCEAISGVGYHILGLTAALSAQASRGWRFKLFFTGDRASLRRAESRLPSAGNVELVRIPFPEVRLATLHRIKARFWVPRFVRSRGCDVFHGPAHHVPGYLDCPTVVTIHDLAFFRHDLYTPEFNRALRQRVRESVEQADFVVAVSEFTRREIAQLLGRRAGVEVIYGAGNYATEESGRRRPDDGDRLGRMGISRPYVLYVGDFGRRKNLPHLVAAFARLRRLPGTDNVRLVMAGNSREAREPLLAKAAALGLPGNSVVLPGRVNDADLALLYRNAGAFALASLAEGFGLVTLEAMSYRVPVVATDTSAIAEGTGDAALLAPPGDAGALAEHLHTALVDEKVKERMMRCGLDRVKAFSWDSAAARTLEIYEQVATRPSGHAAEPLR